MSYPEAEFIVDEALSGLSVNEPSGFPPNRPVFKCVGSFEQIAVYFKIDDSILQDSLVCRVEGMIVRLKKESPPLDQYDGILVGDFKRGDEFTIHNPIDGEPVIVTGLDNDVEYFVRFFPYSDHNVLSSRPDYICSDMTKSVQIMGFHQDFNNLDPESSITYISENANFAPMHSNVDTGTVTDGDWGQWKWLQGNLPYIINGKTGEPYAALDPTNYKKYINGQTSVVQASTTYHPVAWLPKLYIKEVYAADGNSRDVYFADSNKSPQTSDFVPVGFYNKAGIEMQGIWIPMLYGNYNKTVGQGYLTYDYQYWDQSYINTLNTFGSRAVFFGGPILNLIRDVCYMLCKSTDIAFHMGYGARQYRYNVSSYIRIQNPLPSVSARFHGTGTISDSSQNNYLPSTGVKNNTIFHSSVLGTAYAACLDPYTFSVYSESSPSTDVTTVNSKWELYSIYNYQWLASESGLPKRENLLSVGFEKVYSDMPYFNQIKYAKRLVHLGNKYGSIPMILSGDGSANGSNLGVCAALTCPRTNDKVYCQDDFHHCGQTTGLSAWYFNENHSVYAIMILPDPTFVPDPNQLPPT